MGSEELPPNGVTAAFIKFVLTHVYEVGGPFSPKQQILS